MHLSNHLFQHQVSNVSVFSIIQDFAFNNATVRTVVSIDGFLVFTVFSVVDCCFLKKKRGLVLIIRSTFPVVCYFTYEICKTIDVFKFDTVYDYISV